MGATDTTRRRATGAGLALLAGLLAACGHPTYQEPAPAAADAALATSPADTAAPAPLDTPAPDDSAADEAALTALEDLQFRGLGKGDEEARGTLSPGGLAAVGDRDVHGEASRLFDGTGADAATAAGPTYDIDVESFANRSRVQYYMDFFQGPARDRFTIWLGRLRRYEGMVRSRFRTYGVPEDLVYLAMIESGYSNTAVSRARAVGMWQFIAPTARRYGLEVDQWVDERRDPFKATDAAAQHLLALDSMFGSWYLAAAAYNGGSGRIIRGLRRLPDETDSLSDATFFALSDRRYLRRETRDYVPKLIAAALIAKDPRRYGFDSIPTLQPLAYDEVTVPDATGLDVIARLADTTLNAITELNPEYYHGVTPPRRTSVVRVPRGAGVVVAQRYAELPAGERVNFLEHVVRRGETLSGIGQRYDVSVSLLLAANPGVRPRALRPGARLKIPVSAAARGLVGGSRAHASRARVVAAAGLGTFHIVRAGETLWLISQRYGVTVGQLRRWNDLVVGDVLRVGQRLVVAPARASSEGSR
jgi:membrane-bound lytic murein transglycosylase D